MTYVQKREKTGGYYHRRPIAPRLRPFMAAPYTGKTEVYFSLKTKNLAEAEHRAKIEGIQIDRMLFDAERAAKTHGKWALSDTSRMGSWLTMAWANTGAVIEDGGVPIPPMPSIEQPLHSPHAPKRATGHRFEDVAKEYLRGRKLPGKTEHDWRRSWRLFSELTGFDLSGDIGAVQ